MRKPVGYEIEKSGGEQLVRKLKKRLTEFQSDINRLGYIANIDLQDK